ncbi:hypothetical protein C8Q77DRAFT_264174 [Trametes polyzona]|nr:hypothetical protein C8Q77DRAFT_264174 [Trametes polyzona]
MKFWTGPESTAAKLRTLSGRALPTAALLHRLSAHGSQVARYLPRAKRGSATPSGLRSLWVNSLCIIQGSKQDKHREIGPLTVMTASVSSDDRGFLQVRTEVTLLACTHPAQHRPPPPGSVTPSETPRLVWYISRRG